MAWYLIFGYLYSKKYIFIPLRQSLSTPACKHAPKSRYGGACTSPVSKKKYNLKNLLYHDIAKYYKILHTSTNDSFYHPYSWNLAVLDGELSIPQSGGAWCPTCNAKVRVKVTTWRAPSSVFFDEQEMRPVPAWFFHQPILAWLEHGSVDDFRCWLRYWL